MKAARVSGEVEGLFRDRRDKRASGEGSEGAHDSLRAGVREGGGPRGAPHHGGLEGGLRRVKRFDVITIFPAMLDALARPRHHAPRAGREASSSCRRGIRAISRPTHYRRVDDRPYGGGPGDGDDGRAAAGRDRCRDGTAGAAGGGSAEGGADVAAGRAARRASWSRSWPARKGLVLIAGRYEGIDERLVARIASIARCRSATTSPRAASCPRW